jgi:hypothetical protein
MEDHLVSRAPPHREADLVAHRPRREIDRGFLAEESGDHVLQAIDRGIFPLLFIPHLSFRHASAHRWSGLRHRIAVEIDHERYPLVCQRQVMCHLLLNVSIA